MKIMFNSVKQVHVSSRVHASPETVLDRVSRLDGVNQELWPVMKMTWPKEADGRSLFEAPVPKTAIPNVVAKGRCVQRWLEDRKRDASMQPTSGAGR